MSRKRKSFSKLERNVEDKIVDWFQEQELLYRVDADGHSNKTKKDTVWTEGSQLLGIEEEHLRHFIRNMRTLLSKLIKPGKSGARATNLTERKQWVLRRFGFLRNYIQHRRPTGFPSRKEATVEEEDGEEEEEEEKMVVALVDCASDFESRKEEPERHDTTDPPTESASESNLPTITETPAFAQPGQVLKRPIEWIRSTNQPVHKKAKVARQNASATKSRPQTYPPSPIPTHPIAGMATLPIAGMATHPIAGMTTHPTAGMATHPIAGMVTHPIAGMEEEEKDIIKQIRQYVKTDDPKMGMDKQVKSFLEMMGTSMVSLHPKRRLKIQRKLLNLMFDELEQQEREDTL